MADLRLSPFPTTQANQQSNIDNALAPYITISPNKLLGKLAVVTT